MATASAEPADERVRTQGLTRVLLNRPELGAVAGAILVWIIFAVVAGDSGFLTLKGTATYLEVAAQVGIIGSAVALLMIAGEFDLSIGSLLGFSGMAVMIFISPEDAGGFGLPLWPSVGLAMVLIALTGVINGLLVNVTKLPSFGAAAVFTLNQPSVEPSPST